MGFLAFLLIGGTSGAAAWAFYPKRTKRSNVLGYLIAGFLGFIAAVLSSYLGQFREFFQSGQMIEWLAAILASCLIGGVYAALAK